MEDINHRHFKVFKPYGYLSQFISNASKQQSKKFLGTLFSFPVGSMAVGRLDEPSEGLLLVTTSGKTSALVNSKKVDKEYYAQVDGVITKEAIAELKNGVTISVEGKSYVTKPCNVFKLENIPVLPKRAKKIRDDRHGPTSWVSITLNEGKFRQVRKMTSIVGFPTLRLVRVRVGKHTIKKMDAGEVIEIDNVL
ncbi:pseudouridine synthase [Postechiella marina]|uniref:Pseudouridine synthase n=1 Tax=Postechiella marina TaxID=943941 RepID=A0ABP8CIA4_9FLAO